MGKFIRYFQKEETYVITEQTDGFWFWDKTREMNLSMKAKSPQEAWMDAIAYYQRRLQAVEKEHKELKTAVDTFVATVYPENED